MVKLKIKQGRRVQYTAAAQNYGLWPRPLDIIVFIYELVAFITPKPTAMFNEMLAHLHWLAVLAGAAAYWSLGAIWYSPVLFAKPWVKLVGLKMDDPEARKGMPMLFIGSFVLMVVASAGIALLLQLLPNAGTLQAAEVGLLVSVCFSFTSIAVSYLYTRKPMALYAIDCGYHTVGTILSAIVIHLVK